MKQLLEELASLKTVGRQERKDPREKNKTTGERKDVQDYFYYYVDFGLQLKAVKYRLHMMRKAVEDKLRRPPRRLRPRRLGGTGRRTPGRASNAKRARSTNLATRSSHTDTPSWMWWAWRRWAPARPPAAPGS